MRSSKSRSRGNKPNRNRHQSAGTNVVNRVFDSSGPSGKVRGTPQQIIDKYNQLARDAHLGNDRVAAENFQQHAEHYMRLLSEAQREQDAKREEHDRQNRERQADRDRERSERQEREANAPVPSPEPSGSASGSASEPVGNLDGDPGDAPQPDVLDLGNGGSDGDSGLVETPEGTPRKPRSRSRSRKPAAKPAQVPDQAPDQAPAQPKMDQSRDDSGTPEAAE
ncbi:MAG: DUF4167 domain-containing protein [Rhodobacteraceae bacterium]|nr:DUF4167 domain-containing protein [Paracoccaceae bacterium]